MKCSICGKDGVIVGVPPVCLDCARNIYVSALNSRDNLLNEAMKKLDKDADRIYELDPTRGRGRGPKWVS